MNKMQILALLFECLKKIEDFLKNNSFDSAKITTKALENYKNELNNDFIAIQGMADNSDFSSYKKKFNKILNNLKSCEKSATPLSPIDQVLAALISITDCQKKLEEIEKRTVLSDKAKKTLSLIARCQKELEALSNNNILDPSIKKVFSKASSTLTDDFNSVAGGMSDADLDSMYTKYEELNNQIQIIMGKGTKNHTKKETLQLMFDCKTEADDILNNQNINLSENERIFVEGVLSEVGNDYMTAQALTEGSEINAYYNKYANIAANLANIKSPNRHKVTTVVPNNQVPAATKKSSINLKNTLLTVAGIAAATVVILFAIKGFMASWDKDKQQDNDLPQNPGYDQSYDQSIEEPEPAEQTALVIQDIDINDYDALFDFACAIQERLPEGYDISVDDIIYAIRLANFDKLSEKGWFSDRDEVCAATYYIGKLAPVVGVDALVHRDPEDDIVLSDQQMKDIVMTSTDNIISLDSFAEAKVSNGYDIYKAAEICLRGAYLDDEELAFNYAKIMNELVCRKDVNFSVCPDSPVCSYYTIAGMYTANQDRILELTSAKNLGPIYGTGPRIDGGHGALCVEELAAFMYIDTKGGTFIGNENNAIYSYVIDENITNNYEYNYGVTQ